MEHFKIELKDSLQLWRSMYLKSAIALVQYHGNHLGFQVPVELQQTLAESNAILDKLLFKIDAMVQDKYGARYAWSITLDTGDVEVHDNLAESAEDIKWGTSKIYPANDIFEILFPDQVKGGTKCLTFYLTDRCNLKCKYCYENNHGIKDLSIREIDDFLNNIFDGSYKFCELFNAVVLQFIGGEPFLRPDLIRYIIDKFYYMCIVYKRYDLLLFNSFNATTNGTLHAVPEIQYLLSHYPNLQVAVSLDGTKDAHDLNRVNASGKGSWKAAVEASKFELQRNPQYVPKLTYNADTIQYLCDSVLFMHELGVRSITATPALEMEYTKDSSAELALQLVRYANYLCEKNIPDFAGLLITTKCSNDMPHTCGGQGLSITLFPGGKLYTCQRFANMNCQCDADDLSLSEKSYAHVISDLKSTATCYAEKCSGCPIKGRCQHCAAIPYSQTGKLSPMKSTNGCRLYWIQALVGNYYNKLTGKEVWIKEYLNDERMLDAIDGSIINMLNLGD